MGLPPSGGSSRIWARFYTELAQHQIPEDKRSFFDYWVRQWLRWQDPIPPGADPAHFFAHVLEQRGTPEWRCRQAYQAIRLWIRAHERCVAEDRAALGNSASHPVPEHFGESDATIEQELRPDVVEAAQGRGAVASWPEAISRSAEKLKERGYSSRTTETYLDWARRLSLHCTVFPRDSLMASRAVQDFLRHLAVERNLSLASIQQARNALAWLVTHVLGFELVLEEKGNAHHGRRVPTVISPERVRKLLGGCKPPWDLFFGLQYGCGLRLSELLDLRVQDVDLGRGMVVIRRAKGDKDRLVPLPTSLQVRIQVHLMERRQLWQKDRIVGLARVELPGALARKMPDADTSWEWQHVFGSYRPLRHPESGELRRWRPMEQVVRDALREAAMKAGLESRVHPHLLRHCYATHLLELGTPIKNIQELLGHARLETTMIYMHVRTQGPAARSPLDQLGLP